MARHGDYGYDAPYALIAFAALGAISAIASLVSAFTHERRQAVMLAVYATFFLANAFSFFYTTRRGKFQVWNEILDDLHLRGDELVLDMGCGRGAVLTAVARRLKTGRVTGIDLWSAADQSGNARNVTLRNAALERVEDRVEVRTGDMRAMPFASASFDLVVSSLAIHNIRSNADRDRAIAEAWRVLKPGGRLAIADIRATGRYARTLGALGARTIRRRGLGWRFWYGNPFASTSLITASRQWRAVVAAVGVLLGAASLAAQQSTVNVEVRSNGSPVREAEVVVNGATSRTDAQGSVVIPVATGHVTIAVVKAGYTPASVDVDVQPNTAQPVIVDLAPAVAVEEHVTVSATRTDRGIEDQPMRVEVVDREEIDEKAMMTPGDIVMLLNETGGMRVQATSPSLGAASIRIQGMRGRYTRFLSDGLPLFGEQVSLGLMQIPPLDLGRVEVIKGVASSLYGAGAMSGVVNLVSKVPTSTHDRQILLNRSTRGATDATGWYAAPLSDHWGMTFIGSANGQSRTDVNDDHWADLPKYERAVGRPRFFWDNQAGRTLFLTAGGTWENRIGGTLPGESLPAAGPYVEALDTRRADAGSVFQLVAANGTVWSARGSWSLQHQDHRYGEVAERDDHATGFAELTARHAVGRHVLVGGTAFEYDRFQPVDTPQFAYTYSTPGLFVQDDVDLAKWIAVSASARVDHHSEYGSFLSPRISALLRRGGWSSRLSYGTGFFPSTAITEETEAAGLSRLSEPAPLKAERGTSASVDITHASGPLSTTLTLFHSRVVNPVDVERTNQYVIRNLPTPTTNDGAEALGVWKTDDFSFVASYAYVRSRQDSDEGRVEVPLTPRHSLGFDAAWESEDTWRLGVEWYYTGTQRLEANPYRDHSEPYRLFGVLVSRRIGSALLFLNGENLTNVKQTGWDPLLRPSRGVDGRWTVDAWAPLDGRVVNGGIRVNF